MKTTRFLAALLGLAVMCLAPAACSTDGPTSSAPAAPRRSTTTTNTAASDSTGMLPCRDGGGTFGSGSRC